MSDSEELIFKPARRDKVSCLFTLAGPSGSGKTKSALRLATGLAEGGPIGFIDTEHGRASYYAPTEGAQAQPPDTFDFLHLELKEPFRPSRFERAAVISQRAGNAVLIVDSFSHEHVGPGGVLDFHEQELAEMVARAMKRDQDAQEWQLRDSLNFAAWIKPKGEHKHLMQRLWQLNCHIILCVQAAKKIEMVEVVERGRKKRKPLDKGYQPICSDDIPYAMTASFMFSAERPGVPQWIKRFDKLEPLIDMQRPIDEATGERIAAWSRGKPVQGIAQSARQADQSAPKANRASKQQPSPPQEQPEQDEPPPSDEELRSWAGSVAAEFLNVPDRRAYLALVDDQDTRWRTTWLRENRAEIFAEELDPAMKAAWIRTEPQAPPTPPEPTSHPQGALV